MAAELMNFGPQWLRNLSDGSSIKSPPPALGANLPKYKLAEYRYGREEMLALFIPKSEVPDDLKEIPNICVEKTLTPLVFSPPSAEEQHLLSGTVNSAAVLRLMGRGGSVTRGGGRGSGERGRGRGRGRGDGGSYYQRSYEDGEAFSAGRGRNPHRSESWDVDGGESRYERGGYSRGGAPQPGFEEAPQRNFSRSMSSENWRETKKEGQPPGDDAGDWRRAGPKERWGSRGGWRDQTGERGGYHGGEERYPAGGRYDERFESQRGGGRYANRGYGRTKSGSWEEDDDLPEWSTADADEDIGTFDSSGAFMSVKNKGNQGGGFMEMSFQSGSDDLKDEELTKEASEEEEEDLRDKDQQGQPQVKSADTRAKSSSPPEPDRDTILSGKAGPTRLVGGKSRSAELPSSQENVKILPGVEELRKKAASNNMSADSEASGSKPRQDSGISEENRIATSSSSDNNKKASAASVDTKDKKAISDNSAKAGNKAVRAKNKKQQAVAQKTEVSEANKGASNNQPPSKSSTNKDNKDKQLNAAQKETKQSKIMSKQQQPHQTDEANFDHIEKAAENLMAELDIDEEPQKSPVAQEATSTDNQGPPGVPLTHEDAYKWFYQDPQGELQGPFQAAEMAEWFGAGYFTMNLLVKRGCDDIFLALGELMKRWGFVPFIGTRHPAPMKNTSIPASVPNPAITPTSSQLQVGPSIPAALAAVIGAPTPIVSAATAAPQQLPAQAVASTDQLKVLQMQMQMQQQLQHQAVLRQMQLTQIMQALSVNEDFGKLPQASQLQLANNVLMKQELQRQQQASGLTPEQQIAAATAAQNTGQLTTAQLAALQQQQQERQQKLSPRSLSQLVPKAGEVNTVPDAPGGIPSSWTGAAAAGNLQAANSQEWSGGTSVWDIEPSKAVTVEELERNEIKRQALKEKEARESNERRMEEEMRKKLEAKKRQRDQEELERRHSLERQKEQERLELERQAALEQQRREELERKRLADLERNRAEQTRREAEDKRRKEEEEKRRREEDERIRQEELVRQREEEKRKQEAEEQERKRLDEIKRRQVKEKAEDLRRQQQQDALRRMQQEQQLANIQLPQSAQWANTSPQPPAASNGTSQLTMAQIQSIEAEKQKEQEEIQRKMVEQQRQQLAAIQQQQQKANRTWSAQSGAVASSPLPTNHTPSLLEIQQEQARKELEAAQRHQQQSKSSQAAMPLATAAAWGSSTWAQDGAWGNQPKSAGFWEEPTPPPQPSKKGKKQQQNGNNNSQFPALGADTNTRSNVQPSRKQNTSSKSKKEEETVQRLFQTMKQPAMDGFTEWCENALSSMASSVDVPTFVAFLIEVESPYEVHDYVKSYLGETKDATKFAQEFIERRSKHRNQLKQMQQQEESSMWGPAPAVTPGSNMNHHGGNKANNNNILTNSTSNNIGDDKAKKGKKKKMQKVDTSLLGFSCTADSGRVNIGEIEQVNATGTK